MDQRVWQALLHSVQDYNILPVTSVCNVKCIFCSHWQNPPGVEVFRLGHLEMGQVEDLAQFLDRGRKVVIGESATRIIEGEPFTHPQIMDILRHLRRELPGALLQITTNGSLLDEGIAGGLADLSPLEINLSLNSSSCSGRQRLMRERHPVRALEAVKSLAKLDIPFHGSVVAMPWITGWQDLEETVAFLDRLGARTVRVFLPGYTRLAPPSLRFSGQLWPRVKKVIAQLRKVINVPVTLEPASLTDLSAQVEGVIKDSPAFSAGLQMGDKILAVNRVQVGSRVDAFTRILEARDPVVEVEREGTTFNITITKEAAAPSGLVMHYDLDPGVMGLVKQVVERHNPTRAVVFSSGLAQHVLRLALDTVTEAKHLIEVIPVKNEFFGGSIQAAGLLVVEDFVQAWHKMLAKTDGPAPDLILLPAVAFDHRGRDLLGKFYWEMEEITGSKVVVI